MTPELAVWVAELMAAERAYRDRLVAEAHAAAWRRGAADGRRLVAAEQAEEWAQFIGPWKAAMRQPSYAELERSRYGLGGRPSWVIRRPVSAEEAERLEAARLPATAGAWPKDIRRRAARRGDPDPFHIETPAGCVACASWGLPCPP